MTASAASVAGVLIATSALPALVLAWWVSRPSPPASGARLPALQRRAIAIHLLLAGGCLMACGVALHLNAGDARTGVGIAIATLALVNALGVSLWLRLGSLRKRRDGGQ